MKNGEMVRQFEAAFAEYVGAKFAIGLNSGTSTLHTALVALGVKPGDRVAVPPLTMSATTIAVLHAGAVPVFKDVEPDTWLMDISGLEEWRVPVSLYGLHCPSWRGLAGVVDDAAQTLRQHGGADFTSYSFQASKILALGEGGMLVTDDEELAVRARSFSSLGYRMDARQPRIDPNALKDPNFARHHSLGWNYRMNDLTAAEGLRQIERVGGDSWADAHKRTRLHCATEYMRAIEGCDWLPPQHVPEGWTHDYWTYAVACDTPERATRLRHAVVKHGGEMPFPAWKLTYHEPAFEHLAPKVEFVTPANIPGAQPLDPVADIGVRYQGCPVAESLQPRLLQFQTNKLASAEQNARALRRAIEELS